MMENANINVHHLSVRVWTPTVIWLPFEGRITTNDILEEDYSS